jgi:hypothetical protein
MTELEDLDEFDRILVYISMLQMTEGVPRNKFEHFETIHEIFKRRASKKEFPLSSYLAYMQFGTVN